MAKRNNTTTDVFDTLIEEIDVPEDDTAASSDDLAAREGPDCAGVGEMPADPDSNDPRAAAGERPDPDDVQPGVNECTKPDDGTGEDSQSGSRIRHVVRRLALVAAGGGFIAALALSGFLGWQLKQRDDIAAAGRAALEAARTYAIPLTSVDTNDIDKNFAQVLDGATGEFKDLYSQSSAQLRQLLVDNKAESHGTIIDAAVKSASKSRVDVLMFVDQSISNAVNPGPRIDRLRILMTMELVENRWLASHIEIS